MAVNLPFTEDDLRSASGDASFSRGLGYLNRVEVLEITGTSVIAIVSGSEAYEVRLRLGGTGSGAAGVWGSCSCPFGAEGNFCKHCVATGLVVLKSGNLRVVKTHGAAEPGLGAQQLASWLTSLTRDELLAELVYLLMEVPEVASRLQTRAAALDADVDSVQKTVSGLIRITDYVEYREAGAYARDVTRAADLIEDLIDADAAEAIEVARDAIEWMRQSYGMVDDSSGGVGSAAYGLLEVHLLACEAAPPDPVELAVYLADLCLTDEYELIPALSDYAELLGDAGAAALRARVAAAYEANPDEYHARHVMELVLEAEGDVDALVALYATDLGGFGFQHLRIAQLLDQAGRADEALEWAERGLHGTARPNDQLIEYVAARYSAAGRADDVLSLRRTVFMAERTLANYHALRDAAVASDVWDTERGIALERLRKDAAAATGSVWSTWLAGPVLIDALIDEGDLAAAWTAARDIASERQWIRLANASDAERPADALAVYLKAVKLLTQNTGDDVYRKIATHLLAARGCHMALGTMPEFRRYMVLLRTEQKRKRNLMKILDQNGL
jgi:uncharacterized Zn finger protein